MAQSNANAQGADFFGEGTAAGPAAAAPRPTTPDGLRYLDGAGEPTPLYFRRVQAMQGGAQAGDGTNGTYVDSAFQPSGADRNRFQFDAESGTYFENVRPGYGGAADGRLFITNNPAATGTAPAFTVNDIGSSGNRSMAPLGPGNGTVPGRQGTQAEANRANAYYAATGNSDPAANGGTAMGAVDLGAQAAAAQRQFQGLANERGTQAQDMYAQGAAAQGRAPASTGYVSYGPAQTVGSTNAANVNYGPAQTIGQTQQASTGNFGAQQSIKAPTLAQARQAALGNFGAQQSVSAANVGAAAQGSVGNYGAEQRINAAQVGPAALAQAQQAQAYQAANQAGFLAGTAANARNIADLDFTQANESRAAMGDSLNRIRSYVDQGPGESMAQAQLRMAQEQNLGSALSLARSGNGNAAGNMKMAISENAATNAQTNQQAALLRATEADQWRGRQLQGLGLEQQGTTSMRSQDIGAAQAQGQQAISREQIASNVDVSRAGLEQGLAQFNAGAQNQASLTNAELGTRVSMGNAEQQNLGTRLQAQLSNEASIQQAGLANARNIAVGNAGTTVSMGNAEQQNLGTRLQAQLSTDANIQQAALANSRNIAIGQTGSQVNMANAEQSNLTSRLQGQLQSDAAINQASLANSRNIALGQSGTQASIANADNASQRAIQQAALANQLSIAQGDSRTQIGVTNANNSSSASRTQAELANALAVAQGNSSTNINTANLDAQVRQNQLNDAQQQALYGYGVDLGTQQINAANYGAANAFDYTGLGAEIDWRNLDRAAGIKTAEKDRKQKQEAAYISGLAAVLAEIGG